MTDFLMILKWPMFIECFYVKLSYLGLQDPHYKCLIKCIPVHFIQSYDTSL